MNKSACLLTWTILAAVSVGGLRAQSIRAGQHNPEQYFVNVDPDTTFTGPNNHNFPLLPAATYPVDIDGDGVSDLVFHAYGEWVNGMGYTYVRIHIPDKPACQVAAGDPDTCDYPGSWDPLYPMARPFQYGDSIGPVATWSDSLYLAYSSWALKHHSCSVNRFPDDPLGNYIGVRRIRPADTLYGWIKVSGVGSLTMTVEEFASTRNVSGLHETGKAIRIFPNPATTCLMVEPTRPGGEVTVYDALGNLIRQAATLAGRTRIDLGGQPAGFYLIRVTNYDEVILHKIIKY